MTEGEGWKKRRTRGNSHYRAMEKNNNGRTKTTMGPGSRPIRKTWLLLMTYEQIKVCRNCQTAKEIENERVGPWRGGGAVEKDKANGAKSCN